MYKCKKNIKVSAVYLLVAAKRFVENHSVTDYQLRIGYYPLLPSNHFQEVSLCLPQSSLLLPSAVTSGAYSGQ